MSFKNLRITGIPAPLPTDYDRQVSFTDFEILNPGDPPRGVDLDAEFNAIQQAVDETQDRLGLIQRDDGALQNESVGLDQLKTEAKIGVNTPSDWVAFTQYAVNDSVIVNDGAWYIAIVSHVSSATFADDLAAGNWEELIDLTPYTIEAKNWANRAVDSLVPEGDGVDDYSALHHATKADASRVAAQTARTGAETARTGAETARTGAETAQTGAQTARTGAEAAETNAEAVLADFRGRYWGAYASAPALDPNGNAAAAGDLYFNTTNSRLHVYSGAQWLAVPDVIAADIIVTATGNIVSTNVQDALAELDGDLDAAVASLDAAVASLDADKVDRTSPTGAAVLPSGTTAQRPAGVAGYFRWNDELGTFEGFNGTSWGGVGGATGAGGNPIFYENDQTVTGDYTIPATKNAMSSGPITIATGVTVIVSDGAVWHIL